MVEPTSRLDSANVRALLAAGTMPPKHTLGLRIWAKAREGRTVPESVFAPLRPYLEEYSETLEGMIGVWLFRRP